MKAIVAAHPSLSQDEHFGKQTDEGQNPIAWNNRIARIDHDNRLLGKASLLERNIHKVESANMQRSRGSSVVISKFRCSVVSAGNVGRTSCHSQSTGPIIHKAFLSLIYKWYAISVPLT